VAGLIVTVVTLLAIVFGVCWAISTALVVFGATVTIWQALALLVVAVIVLGAIKHIADVLRGRASDDD
jgi:hypothetical protein